MPLSTPRLIYDKNFKVSWMLIFLSQGCHPTSNFSPFILVTIPLLAYCLSFQELALCLGALQELSKYVWNEWINPRFIVIIDENTAFLKLLCSMQTASASQIPTGKRPDYPCCSGSDSLRSRSPYFILITTVLLSALLQSCSFLNAPRYFIPIVARIIPSLCLHAWVAHAGMTSPVPSLNLRLN